MNSQDRVPNVMGHFQAFSAHGYYAGLDPKAACRCGEAGDLSSEDHQESRTEE